MDDLLDLKVRTEVLGDDVIDFPVRRILMNLTTGLVGQSARDVRWNEALPLYTFDVI